MSVYVDDAQIPLGRMKMCHMLADTLPELHAMADKIGVARRWFQNKSTPHYDVALSKRALALQHGAMAVTAAEVAMLIKRLRQEKAG